MNNQRTLVQASPTPGAVQPTPESVRLLSQTGFHFSLSSVSDMSAPDMRAPWHDSSLTDADKHKKVACLLRAVDDTLLWQIDMEH